MTNQNADIIKLAQLIHGRKGLIGCGRGCSVALHQTGRILYAGTNRCGQAELCGADGVFSVLAEADSMALLMEDGTVRTAGRTESESSFAATLSSVRQLAMGGGRMAALLSNGRVLVGEKHANIQAELNKWPVVIDIACGIGYIAGLTRRGRVLMVGGTHAARRKVESWEGVTGLFSDNTCSALYALNTQGELLSTEKLKGKSRHWSGLLFMAASGDRICAVNGEGKLLTTHSVSMPKDQNRSFYVACAVSSTHMLALTDTGKVHAFGSDDFGQCRTEAFGNIFGNRSESFEESLLKRCAKETYAEDIAFQYQAALSRSERYGRLLACSERITACRTVGGRLLTSMGFAAARTWQDVCAVACGNAHVLALHTNGRVSADGNDQNGCCRVSEWNQIRTVAAGPYHSMGLTQDGHVRFGGDPASPLHVVSEWSDIRLLRTSDAYAVGVAHNGIIRIAGNTPFASEFAFDDWRSPSDIVLARTHMVALYANGRVRSTRPVDLIKDSCETRADPIAGSWRRIRAVAASTGLTVALCYGGTVCVSVADDHPLHGLAEDEVRTWKNIVSVGCGEGYIAALTADGRVHTIGSPTPLPSSLTDHASPLTATIAPQLTAFSAAASWTNITAISCGPTHLVALNREGLVLACGSDSDMQCSVTTHFSLLQDAPELRDSASAGTSLRENTDVDSDRAAPA